MLLGENGYEIYFNVLYEYLLPPRDKPPHPLPKPHPYPIIRKSNDQLVLMINLL